jgi:CO dehydrogenase/acetyl-CoA synthase alpha subunit
MYLAQIPFFPAKRANYDITKLKAEASTLFQLYPELLRCLGCGTCTKACPQELDVKGYMAAAMRGDIRAVANMSFDCIMCGMCSARCPAEEPQYNIAILSRRLYGRYLSVKSEHLEKRVAAIKSGEYDTEISKLKQMSLDELKQIYKARDIEPQ